LTGSALLLRTLAKLPLRLIVTTNYDRLMERAFERESQPEPLVVVQPMSGFSPEQQDEWATKLSELFPLEPKPRADHERSILYKIHGSLGDTAAGLIISEEDYIEFLTVVGSDSKAGVPPLISEMITRSSLLFLGYGLEDWDFRTIYKALIEKLPRWKKSRSFAIQHDPSPFWEDFWADKGVTIYNMDVYKFARQLRRRMGVR
jgi:SIR2-like domain